MKPQFAKHATVGLILGLGLILAGQVRGEDDSLYAQYTRASVDTLKSETREMGRKLGDMFDPKSVSSCQLDIDFAEYCANLKKALFYAAKLANYSDYEQDLGFARDKEIFKGLPDEGEVASTGNPPLDRKDFVGRKYERMTENIQEEMETYLDLIRMSLDACEMLAENDLSGFLADETCRRSMERLKAEDLFAEYRKKEGRLSHRYPAIASQISGQIALWDPRAPSPDEPLIDPRITEAL